MSTHHIPATFIDHIVETYRLGDTHSNPCYRVQAKDHGAFDTCPEAAIAYAITNRELKPPAEVYVAVEHNQITGAELVLSQGEKSTLAQAATAELGRRRNP